MMVYRRRKVIPSLIRLRWVVSDMLRPLFLLLRFGLQCRFGRGAAKKYPTVPAGNHLPIIQPVYGLRPRRSIMLLLPRIHNDKVPRNIVHSITWYWGLLRYPSQIWSIGLYRPTLWLKNVVIVISNIVSVSNVSNIL